MDTDSAQTKTRSAPLTRRASSRVSPPHRGTPPSGRSGAAPAGSSTPPAALYARRSAAKFLPLKCRRNRSRARAAAGQLSRQGLSPAESARARAAAGRHLVRLSDATAHCDDLNEGQLRDVRFEDERKVRPRRRRQARRPGPPSPAFGAVRQGETAPEVLDALARGFAAAGQDRHPPRPAAAPTWSAEVPALAPRLYGVGTQAHRIPIFGQWLSRDVTPSLQPTGVLSTRALRRALATRTLRTAGGVASSFGTHSVRRAAAAALSHAGVPRPLVTQALRHASARPDGSYILESA